jgi:DNA-binding NtrC family response regulator
VGAERSVPVDVRVIAATNRCISEEVAENRFRKDLYYRLSVVSIEVPPLRERKSDIPQLAASIATGLSGRIGRRISGIDPDVLTALCRYPWPGNVRELINVLERAMLLAEGDTLTLADLPEDIAGPTPDGAGALFDVRKEAFPDAWLGRPLKDVRDELAARVEKAYLERMLELTDGRVGEAASRAGIEPRSLFNKMQRYGLRKEDYRQTGRSRAGSREG